MGKTITCDRFDGDFPPANYGTSREAVERVVQDVVETLFRDEDGLLRGAINARTMRPFRPEDVRDRPDGEGTYVERAGMPKRLKPVWMNYEDAGQASGVYLEALSFKATVVNDAATRERAVRLYESIVDLCQRAGEIRFSLGGGGRGWFPKPYGGSRDLTDIHECSVDQYCAITLGLHRFHDRLADPDQKKRIEEIVLSFADWWLDHDFAGVYLGQAIWYKKLTDHSMAAGYFLYLFALANHWRPSEEYRAGFALWQRLQSALMPEGDAIWICMQGLTQSCLERLVELRPEAGSFWRDAAHFQIRLLDSCLRDRGGLNRMYEIDAFAANYYSIADRLAPQRGYRQIAEECLDRVRQRSQFYHVLRGQKYEDIYESMRGDDYTDAYSCEGHVQWLCGYWRILCGEAQSS